MGVVRRLPDDLANQIAAGEVVERPASVVKELLENAVDAHATRIRVETEGGGIALVRVSDDGVGMSVDDALLAVERHATSKLTSLDDLRRIATYGFRGEALPSIASVSRLSLRSRRRQDEAGVEITILGGGAPQSKPCGAATGTTIEVRDLFFNVPARRKFLRSLATESAHVTEVTIASALARPELGVTLVRDGRIVREWLRAKTREERVTSSLGDEPLACCRGERGPLRVEAFLGRPEKARASAASLLLFVNSRVIRDRALLRAVAQAYGSVLEPGRYPNGVVYLDLDPELVDVNVHPQKAEVRFADGRAVGDALYRILADELAHAFGIPLASRGRSKAPGSQTSLAEPTAEPWVFRRATDAQATDEKPQEAGITERASGCPSRVPLVSDGDSRQSEKARTRPQGEAQSAGAGLPVVGGSVVPASEHAPAVNEHAAPASEYAPAISERTAMADERAAPASEHAPAVNEHAAPASEHAPAISEQTARAGEHAPAVGEHLIARQPAALPYVLPQFTTNDRSSYSGLRFVAQVRQTYLVCEGHDGLYVLDQHASAERVTFDRLRKAHSAKNMAMQSLLFPAAVDVSLQEAIFVEEHHETLMDAGLDVRIAGPTTVAVYALPRLLVRAKPEDLVRDLLAEITRTGGRAFSNAVDLVLATMACHGSVRAGDGLSPEEATALLAALDHVDFAGHCPHGRPIVTRIPWDELDRKVGRR